MGDGLNVRQYGDLSSQLYRHALVDMLHHWDVAVDRRVCAHGFRRFRRIVDHNVLVVKLVALGLPDFIVRWATAFLQERRQHLKIGDVLSDWLQLSAGIPQ